MSDTLQRAFWDGHPVPLGNAVEMLKTKNGRSLHAVCALRSHQFGWELVLEVNRLLARSQVCRSEDEVVDVTEQWRTAMLESGWMLAPYPPE